MISILTTTKYKHRISKIIDSVNRLSELIYLVDRGELIAETSKIILVENDVIIIPVDWFEREPPFIFQNIPFNSENLLAIIFYKLGNHQKAFEFVKENDSVYNELLTATYLQFGYEISEEMFSKLDRLHNKCIVEHYGKYISSDKKFELSDQYQQAIDIAKNPEIKAFTVKHYCDLLLDSGSFKEAELLLRSNIEKNISENAKNALNIQLAYALMAQLKLPYPENNLDEIYKLFQNGIKFYLENSQDANAGLLYLDASEIANFKGDYVKSKEQINKAILIFKEADIPEFLGEAGLRKATLLYTWSKNGSPQYYKPAVNAFQDTLKIFKRDSHPQKFADVHHNLALIYSEIPVSPEEKPIWTAFCASSFKEVLKFYTKENHPYEFAMANHNYATALMSFPEAKIHNNLDRAFNMFEEALAIRTAESYPFERALTLINQLELYWIMHNENVEDESNRFNLMMQKAKEIKELITDKSLLEKANQHIASLNNLKIMLN